MSAPVKCARAACEAAATQHVVWRNPRIHAEDRRKIWPACDEHVGFLSGYLRAREFPVEVNEGLPE